ncbi:MAG: NUDIX hydrolase [Rhizobiaceae bacterium]
MGNDKAEVKLAGRTRRLFGGDGDAIQVAALPWRLGRDGIEVMLVTSRGTGRWIIPKGWSERGEMKNEAAAREAWEEAGVTGIARPAVVGTYDYDKVLRSGAIRRCHVEVYALQVMRTDHIWPEMCERERHWFPQAEAVAACGEPDLVPVIEGFDPELPAPA